MGNDVQSRTPRWLKSAIAVAALGATVFSLSLGQPALADPGSSQAIPQATDLRVDSFGSPIGLGDSTPGLSWKLPASATPNAAGATQTAYQVRVASTVSLLNHPDLWDSGKVDSDATNNITYEGASLKSRESVVWQVRVWGPNGKVSPWSTPATWEMGLLSNSDWSAAKWIEDPSYTYQTNGVPNRLPIFGKSFDSQGKVVQARLYATGLGQYAATLNGSPVSDAVLEPGQTSYWAEVDYRTYNVTNLVKDGSNVLGIETGSGAYQQADSTPMGRFMFQPNNNKVFGTPKVIAQLELTYANGSHQTIGTDSSWEAKAGPTTFSSWWGGEDYDARNFPANWTDSASNLTGQGWHAASPAALTSSTVPTDTTPLVADPRPPVTVANEAKPVSIKKVTPLADNTTLVGPASKGDTNLSVASVTNLYPGDTINVDSGAGAESVNVTAVGTAAGPATTLVAAAAAGDTNIKVKSVGTACLAGASCVGTKTFIVGQSLLVDTGIGQQTVTVTSVGTAGATGTGVSFTPALTAAHANGITVQQPGTGVTVSPALSSAHAAGAPAVSVPGPTYVLDFGANLAGLPKITGSAPAGTTVSLIPAETVNSDGTVNIGSTGASATSQIRYDYTFSGNGEETWHSQFTYNGFQYLQVRGLPSAPTTDEISLLVTHASNEHTASFNTSDSMLNTIYQITQRSLENNMQSVLTDCPDREKGPYTGDNVQDVQTDLTLFDMQQYEGQLVANMRTSQRGTPVSSVSPGLIANIAPEFHAVPAGRFLDEPNWADAVIVIPWELYKTYGDTATMKANYDAMVKWLAYEAATKQAHGGNIVGLGDWSSGQATDAQPIIDAGYYRGAVVMAEIAKVLGKTDDAATYSALADSLAAEYNAKYLHTDSAGDTWYANNTEASNAVALDYGLVPAQYHQAVVNSLVAAVHAYNDRIGTGSVALGPLFRQLAAAGQEDLIYKLVTNPNGSSYASMVNQGATTLWESLANASGSHDHQFLGDVAAWMVHDVVGIDQTPGSTSYKDLRIRPAIVGSLTHASGSYKTPGGQATVSWSKADSGTVSMDVTVPSNTSAEVWVPSSGGPQAAPSGAKLTGAESFNGTQYLVYDVGPGSYQF